MTEASPIPREVLDRAHRCLCRRIAAAMVMAMAETDTDFAMIDFRVGVKPGWAKRALERLIAGTATDLRHVSDLAVAMGREIQFRLVPTTLPTATAAPTAAREDIGGDLTTTELLKPRGNNGVVSAEICLNALAIVIFTREFTEAEIAAWTQDDRDRVYDWAIRVHLGASDNDGILIPEMPAILAHEQTGDAK